MDDFEIRAEALHAAIDYYRECRTVNITQDVPRQQIVETAMRFEDYIRDGK